MSRASGLSRVAIAMAVALTCTSAMAQTALDADGKTLFNKATVALQAGAPGEAVSIFELLADRGVVHPDVSFNRAVAYIKRAKSDRAQPGDLGRAVAALEETLTLRPGDAGAETALERVQSELSRERSRRGSQSLLVRPSIGRAVVRLLPENFWAISSMLASAVTTLGLLVAWLSKSQRRRYVGKVTVAIAGAFGLLAGLMLFASSKMRHELTPAVVTAPEARLRDAAGLPLPATASDSSSIPEGALVDIARVNDRYAEVLWGETKAWVQLSDVQLLPKR
jgi:hypothetical protein